MKKVILSSTYSNVDTDYLDKFIPEQPPMELEGDYANEIYEVDPEFFERFVWSIDADLTPSGKKLKVNVYVRTSTKSSSYKKFAKSISTPVDNNTLVDFVFSIEDDIFNYFKDKEDKRIAKADLRKSGKEEIAAYAVVTRVINKILGETPMHAYGDTGVVVYYVGDSWTSAERKKFLDDIDEVIQMIRNDYGIEDIYYEYPYPTPENDYIRLTLKIPKSNGTFMYDKNTDTFTKL